MNDQKSPADVARRRDRESWIDQQIREAQERGEFDNLPGKGRPLDLTPNPSFMEVDYVRAYALSSTLTAAADDDKQIREEESK